MTTSPQPPVDYTSRDYAGFVQEMKNAAITRFPEWTSTDPNDFGNVLIEAWAYQGDILSFYGDRIANESFLATATQYDSVLKLAAMLDYSPKGTSAAQVVLTLTVPETALVVIPALTQVTTGSIDSTPVVFETDSDFTMLPSGSDSTKLVTAQLSATQGTTVSGEVLGVSDGTPNQSFSLLQAPVIDGSLYVSVKESPVSDPQLWSFANRIIESSPDDDDYTSAVNASSSVTVTFGDGVTGRIPPVGSIIYATYRVGGGPAGNVGANTITTFTDVGPIADASNGTVDASNLLITNLLAANGGADAESIESIRANAPAWVSAQNRAVTLDDYPAIANSVPRVAKASASGVVYTNVVVYIAPAGAGQPTQDLLNVVSSYFQGKTIPGVSVTISTPVYQPIDIDVIVQATPPYSRSTVKANVINALTDLLAFDNVSFGERVTISSVYDTVQAAPGVDYATIGVLDVAGGTNVADVVLPINTIPVVGTITVSVLGGIDNSVPVGTLGSVAGPLAPSIPGAPMLELMRCDSNSTHFEFRWTEATNADHYNVVLTYLSAGNAYPDNVVIQTTYGPFVDGYAVIDAALVGNAALPVSGRAVVVQAQVQAFNGTAGPITGDASTLTYQCEQSTASTSALPPSQPQVTNFVATSFDNNGNPIYTFDAAWTVPVTSTSSQLIAEVLDENGNILSTTASTLSEYTSLNSSTVTVAKDVANAVRFYVNSYSGSIGPVSGPSVTIVVEVPVIGVSTTTSYVGGPNLVSATAAGSGTRQTSGAISIQVDVEIINTQRLGFTTAYLDSTGATITGSTTALQYALANTGPIDVNTSLSTVVPPPPLGSAPTQVVISVFAANPNGMSAPTNVVFNY